METQQLSRYDGVFVYMQNPSWNHGIMFALEDHHHYLNVAVWLTLKEGKGKLLLGHVREIPLKTLLLVFVCVFVVVVMCICIMCEVLIVFYTLARWRCFCVYLNCIEVIG